LRVGWGLIGVVGTVGALTTVTFTGLDWPLATLQVCDGLGELNADSVRDLRGHAGVGVRDGDLDQNGVERHRCGDLGSEGCRVRVELQRLDHGIEDARSRDDVRVGQDTLLGEVATRQKCAAVTAT
jgi:hypothetical protein